MGESVILEEEVEAGEGVRKLGADYCVGDALAETGDVVNAGCLALAASQGGGITANVFRKPRVAVLVTGNELSDNPCPYEIYDSNSPMLRKLTEACGCDVSLRSAKDNDELITATIVELTKTHDAIIVSGGASVGDYDYLPRIIERRGEVLVHGVSIKPGRPFLFGRVNQTHIFCLPGNPASAFVTFGILVRPALEKIDGKRPISRTVLVHLDGDIEQGNRDEWIRCRISGEHTAEPVAVQGSFGIKSLAAAELLVRVPANTEHKSGDLRSAILLH